MRDARTILPRLAAGLAMAVLAVVLVACGTPAGGRGSVHSGGVSADTYSPIVSALKAGGIEVASESSLRMTYGADRDHVTVSGGGMRTVPGGGKREGTVATVEMRRVGGKWQVASVSGRY